MHQNIILKLFELHTLKSLINEQGGYVGFLVLSEYSHLSNKYGGWNKRGGGAKNAKSEAQYFYSEVPNKRVLA